MKKIGNSLLAVITLVIIIIYIVYHKELSIYLFPANNDRIGELTKLLLSIIGGIGIFYGLVISNRRAIITERSVMKQGEQIELSRKSQIDERFKNAIEHLGDEKEPIILGGVSELVQIAKEDNEKYSEVVFNILCSYIRSKTNINTEKQSNFSPTIIRTIINYLFKISTKNPFVGLEADLSFSNLTGQNIDYCDFSNSNLSFTYWGTATNSSFKNCKFDKARIRTPFFKNNILNGASMFKTIFTMVEFKNQEFKSETPTKDKKLLSTTFTYCKFINVSFDDLNIFESNFICCIFQNCTFKNTDMINSNFLISNIDSCDFSQVSIMGFISFKGSVFHNITFDNIIGDCTFKGCRLGTPEQIFIDLEGYIKEALTQKTQIKGSDFPETRFLKCDFSNFSEKDADEIKRILEEIENTDKIFNSQKKNDKQDQTPDA